MDPKILIQYFSLLKNNLAFRAPESNFSEENQ
jgi:hypothetical protein